MPGIDIYDDSYVEVITDPGVDKAKLVLKNELENQVYIKLALINTTNTVFRPKCSSLTESCSQKIPKSTLLKRRQSHS